MPRKPGDRIESPDTLGRKCWAFAYLRQVFNPTELSERLASEGLKADNFINACVLRATRRRAPFTTVSRPLPSYTKAIPTTMNLCYEVEANCFENTTYTPSRNGTCGFKIADFHYLGFDRENRYVRTGYCRPVVRAGHTAMLRGEVFDRHRVGVTGA